MATLYKIARLKGTYHVLDGAVVPILENVRNGGGLGSVSDAASRIADLHADDDDVPVGTYFIIEDGHYFPLEDQ